MKLLFDQNISFRIVEKLNSIFPELSNQVRLLGLENSSDIEIWQYAKDNGYIIVTFDADFFDISTLKGAPPKIIWLRIGNTLTKNLIRIILEKLPEIKEFATQDTFHCLEIK